MNFIFRIGWLHNLTSVPVLQTTTCTVIHYHVFWWHHFSVVCKGRTQVSFASVPLFSSRATPCAFRHIYAGSLQGQPVASYKLYMRRCLTPELSSDSYNHKGSVFG